MSDKELREVNLDVASRANLVTVREAAHRCRVKDRTMFLSLRRAGIQPSGRLLMTGTNRKPFLYPWPNVQALASHLGWQTGQKK